MNRTGCGTAAVLMASLMFATAHGSPPTVNAEPMDLGADITAKIVKEKSKHSTLAEGMKQGQGSDSSNPCGTVNINSSGNPSDQKSNSGIKEMFGKQQTTIVTGPVINMANCK
jgi:hypothetical protein